MKIDRAGSVNRDSAAAMGDSTGKIRMDGDEIKTLLSDRTNFCIGPIFREKWNLKSQLRSFPCVRMISSANTRYKFYYSHIPSFEYSSDPSIRASMSLRSPSFLTLLITLAFPIIASGQIDERERVILPRFETDAEKSMHIAPLAAPARDAVPPPGAVRTMAEYEELEGIVVRWAYGTFDQLLSQIVDAAQEEGKVWILVRPGTSDSTNIKSSLAGANIPLKNVIFVTVSTNSIWCRDYGPWSVYDAVTGAPAFVDFRYNRPARPQDDLVPDTLGARWGVPVYSTVRMPDSLVHTGGNFMVDGFGTAFSSRLVVEENPRLTEPRIDSILLRYCGVTRFVKMTDLLYDGIHHIDMHMKLLDEETLLVGRYPVNTSDYATIETTVDSLRALLDCYGRPYRILRVPMPPNLLGGYPPNSSYFTYTNALIVNRSLLVPVYGFPLDAQALEIYRAAMPGYTLVGFDCNDIIPSSGAIHCIAKEIGVADPVLIAHAPLGDTTDTLRDYRIDAAITARAGVDSAFLFWRRGSTGAFARAPLAESGGRYSVFIPHQPSGTRVEYYLRVNTKSGRTTTKPLVAPAGTFAFHVVDSARTEISADIAVPAARLFQSYPNPVAAGATAVIPYSISRRSHVTLEIFDLFGVELERLYEGTTEPGVYTALWRSRSPRHGLFFIRLRVESSSGSHTEMRKALLVN